MTELENRAGKCLCGAVSFRADVGMAMQACHCTECQRWTGGGPLLSVRSKNIQMTGEDNIRRFHASTWGERGVCGICGSPIYWKMQGRPIAYLVAGLLDDQSGLHVAEEIFVDYRPDWLPPFEGAVQSTEAEELAKLEAFLAKEES